MQPTVLNELTSTVQRVLVVDDEQRLRSILARYLRARGHIVSEAGNAAEARTLLASAPFDVLLLDVNLPDDTGWDVLRWAAGRNLGTCPRPCVVIVSAVPPSAVRIKQFQPDAVLNKPFPIDALARLVESRCHPDQAPPALG